MKSKKREKLANNILNFMLKDDELISQSLDL